MNQIKKAAGETTIWNKNFICVMAANFLLCLSHSSINPLVASYTKYLGAGAQLTGLLTGMFFAISLSMRPVAGPVTTKIDKRKLLIFVFFLGAAADLGYALFHSIEAFVAFRFLNGVQYSLVGSLVMTLAADHLPEGKLAYGLGLYGIGGAIGNAVAPSIGITLLNWGTKLRGERFGYTVIFIFAMVILLIAVIPSFMLAPDKKTKEDIASTGAWYKNIFTIHALPATLVIFLVMIPYSALNTYMVEFGKEQGISAINIFYLVLALALAITRPMSGYLTTKFGIERIMFPALSLFAISLVTIGFSKSLTLALAGAILAAIGFGSSQPSLQAICMQSEPALRRSVAGNTIYIGMDLGLFLGPFLGGLVYVQSDYSTMFKFAAIPVIIAIACFVVVLPIFRKRKAFLDSQK